LAGGVEPLGAATLLTLAYGARDGQDTMNEKMEQRLREIEEYNLQVQEYYRQREEQRDVAFAQQQEALQVSMIVNN
jgi:hypothetical protein